MAASVGTQWSRPTTGIQPTAGENVSQPARGEGGLRLLFWPPAECPGGCLNQKDREGSGVLRPEGAVTQSPGDSGARGSGGSLGNQREVESMGQLRGALLLRDLP